MGRNESNVLNRRLLRSYFSTIISISLVLFFIGMAGLLVLNARSVSNYFKENITVSVVLSVEASEDDASQLSEQISGYPFYKDSRIISKEEGVEQMKQMLGEDFLDVFEVNPIPVSLELQVAADYISTDSLARVEYVLSQYPVVEDVVYQQSMVELLNSNLERIGYVIGCFTLLLMFVSTVLINNTVRLNIYAKRFVIHTMRLVGATKFFISRPFLGQAFFQGLIAGLIANVYLLVTLYIIRNEFNQLFTLLEPSALGLLIALVVALGVLICVVSTGFVVRSMISLNKDELYY
ncbi:MAG: permease-like cell division protein FtsX [Bacteroidales bacterium]|nr:permease-like cell division protein FtsX [Bacteroidales bacterium]MBQ5881755.1 permease-like cell division protein FtsX [Bacteroidales bacterium]